MGSIRHWRHRRRLRAYRLFLQTWPVELRPVLRLVLATIRAGR